MGHVRADLVDRDPKGIFQEDFFSSHRSLGIPIHQNQP
jgi:hypothetical protein